MNRLKKFITLFLMAVWLPATSHALMETSGVIHQGASEEGSDSDHDAADGKCLFLSLSIKVGKPAKTLAPFELLNECGRSFTLDASRVGRSLDVPGPAPPHLPKVWQFILRAALPVRAPSLAS